MDRVAAAHTTRRDARVQAFGIAAAVLAVDRLTKWLVESRMSVLETLRVIPGFFDIVHSTNRGVAFGMFNEGRSSFRDGLLIGFSMAAIVLVGAMIWKGAASDRMSRWALGLVLGGAAGNLFDRALFGQVTDFLDFYLGDLHWPAFNAADSAIVIGCGLLALELLKPKPAPANRDVS